MSTERRTAVRNNGETGFGTLPRLSCEWRGLVRNRSVWIFFSNASCLLNTKRDGLFHKDTGFGKECQLKNAVLEYNVK